MARGKKSSTLGRNEFLFSGRKHQVAILETNLCLLKNDHRDQKELRFKPVGIHSAYFIPTMPSLIR
jgi:hypothetical protein